VARKTEFAERLQKIMTERGLSQSDVARMIWSDVRTKDGGAKNRQVIGKYLSGEVQPRMATLRKLASALVVPLPALVPESDPLERPGSGLLAEYLDKDCVRVEVNLVVPRAIAMQVVELLSEYAT